ncbi:NADH-quinone oxidoreductase subunit N [Moraxella caviae]|uniref:NADH-quinone oxidoreductase subunit N n=1 Tax=Moraxella caviae TaxID=34060 RepID=A0A1S9ZYC0_9GAMM|nr:NADH-quinone oxidoreductase subunit N [Moraxella caviae]OOR88514.1 NADH-quinone oxidoreductase subunit N [Moraxella caviae]STZ14923.1 NADH-quinone oxidoreductase subunit N [Moraxella caviae]VEW12711.1 NADH-quinone oxidoreductase subunit N [Moraxella caviae]
MNSWLLVYLPLAPMVVVAITALVVMLAIATKRSHFWTATLSVIGLNAALLASLLLFLGNVPVVPNPLFVVDGFALFNMIVVLIAALACCTLSYGYFGTLKDNKDELYLLMLIATLGALLMTSAQHLAAFFMALELLSVPMYGMLAYTFLRSRSLEAGLKYLVLSAAASATLLMGMAFIFADVGTLQFADFARILGSGQITPLFVLGAVMMFAAIAFKLSAAPFHAWVSDVYEGAPAPVAAFLASVSKVAMMALALRFLATSAIPALTAFNAVLIVVVVASIVLGNVLALRQTNLKRLLAFSSVAHIGYALVPLLSVGAASTGVASMYMAVYALTSIGAFGVITLMSSPYRERGHTSVSGEADDLRFYQGLFWRRPVLTGILTVMLLSLAGIPLTAGFMTKFVVILTSVQGMRFWAALLIILGSAIGLAYYLRVLVQLYQKPKAHLEFDAHDQWGIKAGGIMLFVVTVLIVLFGVLPNGLIALAGLASIA